MAKVVRPSSFKLIREVRSEIPQTKFAVNTELRLPTGCKPRFLHDKPLPGKSVVFMRVLPGSEKSTLSQALAFVENQGLAFANLHHTHGVAMNHVGGDILRALGRKPTEGLCFFCIGTRGVDSGRPPSHYFPLVVRSVEGKEPHLSMLSRIYVEEAGLHCQWVVPLLSPS
jgi:hypothetical protein